MTIRINLLPWREEQRKERQRQFVSMLLGTLVLGILLVYSGMRYFDYKIKGQQQRNQLLQQEIANLEEKTKRIEELRDTRDNLLARKQVIEQLQGSRSLTVEMFDQLVKTTPAGVTLQTVNQQGMNVTITGTTQSNARVATYLQNLKMARLFRDPQLKIVENDDSESSPTEPYMFRVDVRLRVPEGEVDQLDEGEVS